MRQFESHENEREETIKILNIEHRQEPSCFFFGGLREQAGCDSLDKLLMIVEACALFVVREYFANTR